MILLNSEKSKSFLKINEKISEYEKEINFSGLKCTCRSRSFDIHGSYKRNVIENGEEYKIEIKRVKCKECKQTHALIPSFLMPYYQSVAEEMVESVSEMVEKEKSTTQVEKEKGISRQKLNWWRKRYIKLKKIIRETYGKILKIKEFLEAKKRIEVYHNWKTCFLIQVTT